MTSLTSIFTCCFLIGCLIGITYADEDLNRLVDTLIRVAGKDVIPQKNRSDTVTVSFGMALIQIIDVDVEKNTIELDGWARMSWKDFRLEWDPTEYGDRTIVRLPTTEMWTPDITLYNGVYNQRRGSSYAVADKALSVISNDGTVLLFDVVRVNAKCHMDMSNFPYDTQSCTLKYGSWVYDGFTLDLQFYNEVSAMDLNDYIDSNMWNVEAVPARRNVKFYPCCVEPYPDLTFNLTIARMSTFYTCMLVLPALLLCLLIPFVFLIPLKRPEKFPLGGTVLVCMLIMMVLLQLVVPTSHTLMTGIERLCLCNVVLSILSLAASVVVLRISAITCQLPASTSDLIRKLGKLCCAGAPSAGPVINPTTHKEDGPADSTVSSDWLIVGYVIDRVLFAVFTVCSVVCIVVFCPTSFNAPT